MPQGVACSVSNCAFWSQGNKCGADEIAIDIDGHAAENLHEEFGEDSFEARRETAKASSSTCCLTFRPVSDKS